MEDAKIKQPMPKEGLNFSYVVRYESEIDRTVILDTMGHYIEQVLGTRDVLFVKVSMEAINRVFRLNPLYPGEEIEFVTNHRHNNIVRYGQLSGDELPPLWSVLTNDAQKLNIITTIEPCKFIIDCRDISRFEALMATVEIAPKEYDYAALAAVHWNDTTTILKRDVEFFITGKKFFDSRGMAYSRSYLLHGPPGNGKTTTIKAIAKFLNARPETFDFSAAMTSPDRQFTSWFLGESEKIARDEPTRAGRAPSKAMDDKEDTKTPIRLLVLEDIDRLFPKDMGIKQTSVSLQAVLQALDGAVERRNMLVIATANEPKQLDQHVLARPGRFDKQVFYEQPSQAEAFRFLKALFEGEAVTDAVLQRACERLTGHSYALHKELFATSASYTIERTSRTVEDADVLSGLEDLIKHVDVTAMRSKRPDLGFAP